MGRQRRPLQIFYRLDRVIRSLPLAHPFGLSSMSRSSRHAPFSLYQLDRRKRLQEWRAGQGQSPKQIPKCKSWIGFQLFPVVHAGYARKLSFEMGDGAQIRIVGIEITEGATEQGKKLRFVMVALGANFNQLDKVSCRLCA